MGYYRKYSSKVVEHSISVLQYLAQVAAVVRVDGEFITGKVAYQNGGDSTAKLALRVPADRVTDADREVAQAAIAYAANLSDAQVARSDFNANLKANVRESVKVTSKNVGTIAYAVEAVRRDSARAAAKAIVAEKAAEVSSENLAGVVALLTTARDNGKQFPKIKLTVGGEVQIDKDGNPVLVGGKPVVLGLAGNRSKTPGAVNITDDRRYPDNIWYGRISKDGVFQAGRVADDDVFAVLKKLAADPTGTVSELGKLTNCCVFCNKRLDDPRSKAAGYGLKCSKNHNQPYPSKAEAEEILAREAEAAKARIAEAA